MRKPLNVPPREEILPEYIVKQSEEICKSLKQLRFRKIALLQAVGEQNRCALSVCNNILILVVQFRQLGNIVCCVFLIDRRVGSIRLHSASASAFPRCAEKARHARHIRIPPRPHAPSDARRFPHPSDRQGRTWARNFPGR